MEAKRTEGGGFWFLERERKRERDREDRKEPWPCGRPLPVVDRVRPPCFYVLIFFSLSFPLYFGYSSPFPLIHELGKERFVCIAGNRNGKQRLSREGIGTGIHTFKLESAL